MSNVRDQVVPVLGLLQAPKRHLRARDVFLRVLEVFELPTLRQSDRIGGAPPWAANQRTSVSSFHVIPLALFASV